MSRKTDSPANESRPVVPAAVLVLVLLVGPAFAGKLLDAIRGQQGGQAARQSSSGGPRPSAPAMQAPRSPSIQSPTFSPAGAGRPTQSPFAGLADRLRSGNAFAARPTQPPTVSRPTPVAPSAGISILRPAPQAPSVIARQPAPAPQTAPTTNSLFERLGDRLRATSQAPQRQPTPTTGAQSGAEKPAQVSAPSTAGTAAANPSSAGRTSLFTNPILQRLRPSSAPAASQTTPQQSAQAGDQSDSTAQSPPAASGARSIFAERLSAKSRPSPAKSAGQPAASSPPSAGSDTVKPAAAKGPDASVGSAGGQRRGSLIDRLRERHDEQAAQKQQRAARAPASKQTDAAIAGMVAPAGEEKSQPRGPGLRQVVERKRVESAERQAKGGPGQRISPDTSDAREHGERSLGDRMRGLITERRAAAAKPTVVDNFRGEGTVSKHTAIEVRRPHVMYHDRPQLIEHGPRPVHTYLDLHNRVCHRIIWPDYHYPVYYRHGPFFSSRCVYPFYQRKYVFVSLGGWWPVDYTYVRYYWYGWHPVYWYGYYPIPYEVGSDTYNYYTYNYYSNDQAGYSTSNAGQPGQAPPEDYTQPVDHTTYADIREKLAKKAATPPAAATAADALFEEAVKAFESADYKTAVEQLAGAVERAPEDVVLPFAYSQALFANEQYSQAADVLRQALAKVTPDKEGIFYPRGLYANDDLLFEHLQKLLDRAEQYNYDMDLQLLLGYHLLGIGETDSAIEPLEQASQDMRNAPAAKILLDMAQKIKAAEAAADSKKDVQQPQENADD